VHQRSASSGRHGRAVLHIPGFVDYFFHTHLAQAWLDAGIEYYALDQRGQGRASQGLRRIEDIRDLTVREEDIRAALAVIRAHDHTHVTLLGHSTGGLQAAVYADHPDAGIDALVLNSPWLDVNRPPAVKAVATALAHLLTPLVPTAPLAQLGAEYPRDLHVRHGGEWDFRTDWKVLDPFPARAGFLHAVRELQARVARGLDIRVPVLVATSGRAGDPTKPEDLASADCVLDPADMHRLAPKLGKDVEVRAFPGGRHDLSLSAAPVRDEFAAAVVAWALEH
ncbi:MAG: alpha/beta fold hydrolase, partial [Actinobacteria bacterium]|nr:alpha/beta fold hydrolase [Actinomycetota bacterium]